MDSLRHGLVIAPRAVAREWLWGWLGGWPGGWLGRRIGLAIDTLYEWRRRHRSRARLQAMSDHMCKDIGISSADAWREARKPFWKA